MLKSEWELLYQEILADMGYSRSDDESSAKLLKVLMSNADLIDDDDVEKLMQKKVVIVGPHNPDLTNLEGCTVICAGSAISCFENICPDILVTDLDGDIQAQIETSKNGAITFMHAHGDNTDLIMNYAKSFTGPIVLTTQSVPDNVIRNYGGFTDGDRAVCMAKHFGAHNIELRGFDFTDPVNKDGSSPEIKLKKLHWAEKIIDIVLKTQ